MPFKIIRNDITKMEVDAIVNTANEEPIYAEGTDMAVYLAAGEEELLKARREIGVLSEGEVAITPGFQLPARFIIHAVSPLYLDGECGEEQRLRSCYRKSLELAAAYGCKSIAFPLIGTGGFGYPKEEGMRIAMDEINGFLLQNEMQIYLVVFDTESTRLGRNIYPELEAYIDSHYVEEKLEEEYEEICSISKAARPPRKSFLRATVDRVEKSFRPSNSKADADFSSFAPMAQMGLAKEADDYCEECDYEERESALEERMKHMSDTFQQYLLYLIESKGLTNAQVYRDALISKQLFSKIKLNPYYHPDKATAMRLCVGARLNLDETKDLLARAGYALSPCDKRDIIFSFFIEQGVFDMFDIDIALEEYGLPCFIE